MGGEWGGGYCCFRGAIDDVSAEAKACEGAGSRPPIDLLAPVAGDGLLDPSAGSRELSKPKGLHPSWLLKVSCVDEVDRSSKSERSLRGETARQPLRLRADARARAFRDLAESGSRLAVSLGGSLEVGGGSGAIASGAGALGVLRGVELWNRESTSCAGIGLEGGGRWFLRARKVWPAGLTKKVGGRVDLGSLECEVRARPSGSGPAPGLEARARLRTPVGFCVSGRLCAGGGASARIDFNLHPRLLLGGRAVGVASSSLSVRGAALRHELSFWARDPVLSHPERTHYDFLAARPRRVEFTPDLGLQAGEAQPGGETQPGKAGVPSKRPKREVAVVGGHWIDPGGDTGAPGEREVNLHIADRVTQKLSALGYAVWRPEYNSRSGRQAYTWLEYLDWVGDRTREGVPVVEVHGQGRVGGIPAVGVIGCPHSPLNAELARVFGHYPTDHVRRGVPRHGGTIVEAFDTDELREVGRRDFLYTRLNTQ